MFAASYDENDLELVRNAALPLTGPADLDPLMNLIGNSRIVLLGEASHGTHEYYTWRTQISRRLITEKGFNLIAVEGDWPDCYRINRFIRHYNDAGEHARDVLQAFNRWPTWMWANWEIVVLSEWLRTFNAALDADRRVGFYGLDVYSLWESMEAIWDYLQEVDKDALKAVQKAMDCFEPFNIREGFSYAERSYGLDESCRTELEKLLSEIRKKMPDYPDDPESTFSAEQNALVALNAERYYKDMMRGGASTWNIRDHHMAATVNRLLNFHGGDSKMIIWEHNTHIGDARATNMQRSGLVTVGQLVKQEHEEKGVIRVGFGSYKGTVLAADSWSLPVKKMQLPEARNGSWEHLLHSISAANKLILSKDIAALDKPIGHRAIGVVYDPDFESGNYVPSILPSRYEAFIYLEETTALHPLDVEGDPSQMPETYPFGV